jgi:DNA adenine methylase
MFSNKLYTPLRYPGGKARFAGFLASVMRYNGILGGQYLEPYAGGAGVALALLFDGHASHVHINDLDPAINSFWLAATKHSNKLIALLRETPVTMQQWHYWRAVMRQEIKAGVVERGFATLFMNRTNRSGILKGGVIGGKLQDGAYKLDARFDKEMIEARLSRIADHRAGISVHCEDAFALLRRCAKLLPKKSLVYLDPPYYLKGRGLYRNFYCHDDHVAIARLLQSATFRRRWVVSYDNAPQICAMYDGCRALSYGLHYTAQERYTGDEVMFFGGGVRRPIESIPGAVKAA